MTIATATIDRPQRGHEQSVDGVQVLAAERLNLRNQTARDRLSTVLLRDRVYANSSWKWFGSIAEVHYALTRAAKIAGYAKLRAVRFAPDGVTVESEIENGLAADIVSGIYSRVGGVRGLIERYFIQMKVPGESHLIRWSEGKGTDGYMFASSKELSDGRDATGLQIEGNSGKLKLRTMPTLGNNIGAFERTIAQKDYLGRVWMPSHQWLDVPESPLEALDIQCDMLDTMTRSMRAALKSRFATAGLLYFSNKVRDAIGNKHATKQGTSVLNVIYEIMKENTVNAENADDITAILPILMMGEAEVGKVVEHITMDRQIFETDLKLRGELIDRILFGLDINAPATEGNDEASHWNAWSNNADELRLAVIPDVEALCWTANRLILRPAIQQEDPKADLNRIGVWYNLDEASVKANRTADAGQIRDRGGIKMLSLLKAAGFTNDDALAGAEYVRWIGQTLRIPKLAMYGTPEWGSIDWEDPALAPRTTGRIADKPAGDAPSGPGEGDPGAPSDSDDDTPDADKPI